MPRPKRSDVRKRINLDLPQDISDIVENLTTKLDCDSRSELIRRSLSIFEDYIVKRNNRYTLIAVGENECDIPYPHVNYHKVKRKRFNLDFKETIHQKMLDLMESSSRYREFDGAGKPSLTTVVCEAVSLVDKIYLHVCKGEKLAYERAGEREFVKYLLVQKPNP
jgi:Arc/MetJ-type ribon-helix-helix transcriptional regulator